MNRMRRTNPGPKLFAHDRALGARFVAGADEAGRGCLAGPLVAAAVLFDQENLRREDVRALAALNDSKRQTPASRAALYPLILRTAAKVSIVSRCAPGIDQRGLHVTNLAALREALLNVACEGALCLSDGFSLGEIGYEHRAVIKGDATSAAIAAASVLAKETRDRYMRLVGERNPRLGVRSARRLRLTRAPQRDRTPWRHAVATDCRFSRAAYQQLQFG